MPEQLGAAVCFQWFMTKRRGAGLDSSLYDSETAVGFKVLCAFLQFLALPIFKFYVSHFLRTWLFFVCCLLWPWDGFSLCFGMAGRQCRQSLVSTSWLYTSEWRLVENEHRLCRKAETKYAWSRLSLKSLFSIYVLKVTWRKSGWGFKYITN